MDKTIHGNRACIQPAFVICRTQLTGKPSPPFERVLNSGLETTYRFNIYFVSICT